MSKSFRPVKEIRGRHSGIFIEPEEFIALLHDLAARADTASDDFEYGDCKVVWIEEGSKALDYVEYDGRFNATSFHESLREQGIRVNKGDLKSLIKNMKAYAAEWRHLIGEDGELSFYVDSY